MEDATKDEATMEANNIVAGSITMKSLQSLPLVVPILFRVANVAVRFEDKGLRTSLF